MEYRRISRRPVGLRDQLLTIVSGIAGEANWPATAPSQAEASSVAEALDAAITQVDQLAAQLAAARAVLHDRRDESFDFIKRIDQITSGLYGPRGAAKNNFGLPPKKSTASPSVRLEQVVITHIADGTAPASIVVDWNSQQGAAAYQIEWFTDSALTAPVGNAAVSESDYEIPALTIGQQVWIRVRAIRGNAFGSWSDPATRVANV